MKNIYDNVPVVHIEGAILKDKGTDWVNPKLKSIAVAAVMDDLGRSTRMFDCGSDLQFAVSATGVQKLYRANFCKDRMCPACQRRRSLVIFHQVKNVCQSIQNENPTFKYVLLTLTVPNVPAERLSDEVKHLAKSWDRLSKRVEFKNSIKGYFRATEVTYNGERDDYHPHLHVLLCVPSNYFAKNYIKQSRWLELWQESTRYPNITQVDVRAIKPNPKRSGSDSISSAAAEVGKYATKPSQYVTRVPNGSYVAFKKVVNELAKGIARKRLISYGGIMKTHFENLGLESVENENANLIDVDGNSDSIEAVYRVIYQWNVGIGNYAGI